MTSLSVYGFQKLGVSKPQFSQNRSSNSLYQLNSDAFLRSVKALPFVTYHPDYLKFKDSFQKLQFDQYGVHCMRPIWHAKNLLELLPKELSSRINTILDPMCSIGGLSIGFALAGKKVIASDISQQRLNMAKHNAYKVFELSNKDIQFEQKDAFEQIKDFKGDCIVLEPPFGNHGGRFSLNDIGPLGYPLIQEALNTQKTVIVSLPKSCNLNELKSFNRDFTVLRVRNNPFQKHEVTSIVFHSARKEPQNPTRFLSDEQAKAIVNRSALLPTGS